MMGNKKEIQKQILHFKQELSPARLLAVTKYSELEDLISAYEAGQRDFGESRIQDLKAKAEELSSRGYLDIRWHFIGHIQSNKFNRLLKIPGLTYIHSIDSFKILEDLYKKEDHFEGQYLRFFLEFKTTDEDEKGGIDSYDELAKCTNFILNHPQSKFIFHGLMTMGPIRTENFEEDAIKSFKKLRKTRDQLKADFDLPKLKLSMGMSSDYKFALKEGSDWVRIGSSIFKE
ncbi:MAG: YggS family pyridoxal phosphate-dependent enzyme [Deltaproteobacteria bacterium]|nr:MAG: YggS family pyridoxal phosphate-dependent enzyme [Deltaproteobacteria bacterium]TNF25092.1 MAG: YggS family pyridoxal phosphate-dependent enzyme [Deltaproteobacteria bacterium]